MAGEFIFSTAVVLIGALAASIGALYYFKQIRMERPAIGVFNARDIVFLLFLIVVLPLLYIIIPQVLLVGLLVVTFISALTITLRPVVPVRLLWFIIPAALLADIVVAQKLLGTQIGWEIYWTICSLVVLLAAVGVSNLYVQGGMRLRNIAWFALALGAYDFTFAFIKAVRNTPCFSYGDASTVARGDPVPVGLTP